MQPESGLGHEGVLCFSDPARGAAVAYAMGYGARQVAPRSSQTSVRATALRWLQRFRFKARLVG